MQLEAPRTGRDTDLSWYFIWASGIEDTFVPQTRTGYRALDEYELMGHYEHWRRDLALARDLGVQALRWGVPWYRVEPQRGVFDWRWTDQVIPYLVQDVKITPIIDLMHYGCPFWLQDEFASPAYPEAVTAYAAAFAERYRDLVCWYTPLNEPIVTALMCGRRGVWPPYLRGDTGYVRVMIQLARGMQETSRALKQIDEDTVLVHVEATGVTRAKEGLAALLIQEQAQHFLAYDLITGKVGPDHVLFPWLLRHGASWHDLDTLHRCRIGLDVVGLNFYPQWSTRELYLNRRGQVAHRAIDKEGSGFAEMIRSYHERYRAPIMITETSAGGGEQVQLAWLRASTTAVKALRAEGIPVIGYTWFPMFTMIDWQYRFGEQPASHYRIELGLYRLDEHRGGRWRPTTVTSEMQARIADSAGTVGPLATVPAETSLPPG